MSEQGFKNVPGVPDGWELLRIDFVTEGEWYIFKGKVDQWESKNVSESDYPIIRKIEGFKTYRPFVNGAEYIAKRRDGIAVNWKTVGADGFYAVVSANASFVWVAFGDKIEHFTWNQAFEKLVFRHADGSASPFGVEVTE